MGTCRGDQQCERLARVDNAFNFRFATTSGCLTIALRQIPVYQKLEFCTRTGSHCGIACRGGPALSTGLNRIHRKHILAASKVDEGEEIGGLRVKTGCNAAKVELIDKQLRIEIIEIKTLSPPHDLEG